MCSIAVQINMSMVFFFRLSLVVMRTLVLLQRDLGFLVCSFKFPKQQESEIIT